jgi:hypothetical protein
VAALARLIPGPLAACGRVANLALMRLNAGAVPAGYAPVVLAVSTPAGLVPVPPGHPAHGGPVGPQPAATNHGSGDGEAG